MPDPADDRKVWLVLRRLKRGLVAPFTDRADDRKVWLVPCADASDDDPRKIYEWGEGEKVTAAEWRRLYAEERRANEYHRALAAVPMADLLGGILAGGLATDDDDADADDDADDDDAAAGRPGQ